MLNLLRTTIRRDTIGLTVTVTPLVRADLRAPDRIRRQMASDLRGRLALDGGVGAQDLELIGWTSAQIKAHAPDAITLARRLAGIDAPLDG